MAIMHDREGKALYASNGSHIVITTEGETKARDMRRLREEIKRAKQIANYKARIRRTPEQQLAVLDARLGEGIGAKKERAKLYELIEKRKELEAQLAIEAAKRAEKQEKKETKKNRNRS